MHPQRKLLHNTILQYLLVHAGDICPYGIDPWLWLTHFGKLVTTFFISSYADTLELSRAAIYGQTMARVLFFVNVKAVLNTIMVYTGWKRPGAFKVTQKAGGQGANNDAAEVAVGAPPTPVEEVERDNGGPTIPVRPCCALKLQFDMFRLSQLRHRCFVFAPILVVKYFRGGAEMLHSILPTCTQTFAECTLHGSPANYHGKTGEQWRSPEAVHTLSLIHI